MPLVMFVLLGSLGVALRWAGSGALAALGDSLLIAGVLGVVANLLLRAARDRPSAAPPAAGESAQPTSRRAFDTAYERVRTGSARRRRITE